MLLACASPSVSPDTAPAAAPAVLPPPPCPLEARARPPVPEDEPVAAPRKRAWEQLLGGRVAARPYVRARLRGWPSPAPVAASALPSGDEDWLRRLAADTWRGLDALADRESALPVDHVRVDGAPHERSVGDYANVSTVGLYLTAVVAAHDLGLLAAAAARARVEALLATIEGLETRHGHLFNYYDTTSRERTSNFLSFVDAGWLAAGLMVARGAFPELHARCARLVDRMDFAFFYDRDADLVRHGYNVRRRTYSRYHYGMLFTEARLPILIAIGKGDLPAHTWFAMARTYPPNCRGQSLPPRGVRRKVVSGYQVWDGYYEWQGARFVPSWGGSMFEALMPTLLLDEPRLAPRGLGANGVAHALVQRRYATETLGYPVWGMSSSVEPGGRDYAEFGVPVLGTRGYPAGAVTPHAAVLALAVAPAEARANLRRLAAAYDLYGDFGFYDAVDPRTRRVARRYLALDQSMILIALANHLEAGAIQRRFETDPIVQPVLPLLAAEDFVDQP